MNDEVDDLRRRVEALEAMLCQGHEPGVVCRVCEHRYTVSDPEPMPPGCPACDGVAGTACRCPEPVICEQVEPGGLTVCTLDAGHAGPHEAWGVRDVVATWPDPEPPAASIMHPVFPRCHCPLCDPKPEPLYGSLQKMHDPYKPEPEPLPRWRQMVDEQPDWIEQAHRDDPRALAWTLENLAQVALETEVPRTLARVIAICEAKVGDGWQADPDSPDLGYAGIVRTPLQRIMGFIAQSHWNLAGCVAAAWLRDLTEADA